MLHFKHCLACCLISLSVRTGFLTFWKYCSFLPVLWRFGSASVNTMGVLMFGPVGLTCLHVKQHWKSIQRWNFNMHNRHKGKDAVNPPMAACSRHPAGTWLTKAEAAKLFWWPAASGAWSGRLGPCFLASLQVQMLCVSASLWQIGSLCKVLPGLPHSTVPQHLALSLHPPMLACSLCLPLALQSYHLSSHAVGEAPWQTSFCQRKRVCISGSWEFVPLNKQTWRILLVFPSGVLSASWLPRSVHLWHFNFRPGFKKKSFKCWMWQGEGKLSSLWCVWKDRLS